MSRDHLDLGAAGEQAAAKWYRTNGYRIITRNWRNERGEIDLICRRDHTVVFVEVKTRTSGRYGTGFAAVDWRKQTQVRRLAHAWLSASDRYFDEVRFDVVDVDHRGHIQVIEAAF